MADVVKIGSLFTGWGGLDLAAEFVFDARTVWTCDNDPGAAKIIAQRFPHAPNHGDITTVDWSTVEPVDILTFGFRGCWGAITPTPHDAPCYCISVHTTTGEAILNQATAYLNAVEYARKNHQTEHERLVAAVEVAWHNRVPITDIAVAAGVHRTTIHRWLAKEK